jgi:hypothetical protein
MATSIAYTPTTVAGAYVPRVARLAGTLASGEAAAEARGHYGGRVPGGSGSGRRRVRASSMAEELSPWQRGKARSTQAGHVADMMADKAGAHGTRGNRVRANSIPVAPSSGAGGAADGTSAVAVGAADAEDDLFTPVRTTGRKRARSNTVV